MREEGKVTKKQKVETQGKILGEVLTGVELAQEVDWQKHRQEILEEMRKEEEQRQRRIEKKKKLEESWEDPGGKWSEVDTCRTKEGRARN